MWLRACVDTRSVQTLKNGFESMEMATGMENVPSLYVVRYPMLHDHIYRKAKYNSIYLPFTQCGQENVGNQTCPRSSIKDTKFGP